MYLSRIALQAFRSYKKATFSFTPNLTVVVGPNTAGKSNLLEAIGFLSRGKSLRAEKDIESIMYEQELARITGTVDDTKLELLLTRGLVNTIKTPFKKFLVNGVAKRRVDFCSYLPTVSFAPTDLDLVGGGPSLRRNYLDDVLEQTDREYSLSLSVYIKALRQRNALLQKAKETGVREEKEFRYWDELLITHGQYLTKKREETIQFLNTTTQEVFSFQAMYDKSDISAERLFQYKDAEIGAGVTLVGPHRDDVQLFMKQGVSGEQEVKSFGSRGQQRLLVLQLKLLQLDAIERALGKRPLLLLDDIFSELDNSRIELVSDMIDRQQTIMTTTHKEFVHLKNAENASVIELKRNE